MARKSTLVFGSDPEIFAAYRDEDGELAVLPPVVLRTDLGYPVIENGRHPIFKKYGETFVHEDGGAFEISTPPSSNWEDMWSTISQVKELFSKDVLSNFESVCFPNLFSLPAMRWQVDRWINRGEEFRMATEFGCDPDFDVFDSKTACKIFDASKHPWRYAGGHIHVSGMKELETQPLNAIKSMVLTAGLAATANSDVPNLERERIFLYGKPGKFRIQQYPNGAVGIEYRTPSTRWTENHDLAKQIFTWARIGMENLLHGGLLATIENKIMEEAKKAIVEVDQVAAKNLLAYIETQL
jgi:hypothetical protein